MTERVLSPPEWTSRQPWPDGVKVPGPAAKLLAGVKRAGWCGEVTYSRGWAFPVKLVDPEYPVATVAVRFWRYWGERCRGGHVVYYCRLDRVEEWEAKSLMVFGSDHWPVIVGLGVTDVKEYLTVGAGWTADEVEAWRKELREREKAAKERAATAAKERGRKVRTGVN